MEYYLAIDQSTTSTKMNLYNQDGQIFYAKAIEFEQIVEKPGWLSHDFNKVSLDIFDLFSGLEKYLQENDIPFDQVKSVRFPLL